MQFCSGAPALQVHDHTNVVVFRQHQANCPDLQVLLIHLQREPLGSGVPVHRNVMHIGPVHSPPPPPSPASGGSMGNVLLPAKASVAPAPASQPIAPAAMSISATLRVRPARRRLLPLRCIFICPSLPPPQLLPDCPFQKEGVQLLCTSHHSHAKRPTSYVNYNIHTLGVGGARESPGYS